jgi:hypothetical protein
MCNQYRLFQRFFLFSCVEINVFPFQHANRDLLRQVPPFPNDVPTAHLPRLSLSKLLKYDVSESDAPFTACRIVGFFLLDFQGCSEGEAFLKKAEMMFEGLCQHLHGDDSSLRTQPV